MRGKSVVGRQGGGGGGGGRGDVGEQALTDQLQVAERFSNITRYEGAQYQEEKSRSAVSKRKSFREKFSGPARRLVEGPEVIVICWHGRDSW